LLEHLCLKCIPIFVVQSNKKKGKKTPKKFQTEKKKQTAPIKRALPFGSTAKY